jgi:hypothetical protein
MIDASAHQAIRISPGMTVNGQTWLQSGLVPAIGLKLFLTFLVTCKGA